MSERPRLRVLVDGEPLVDAEARAFWERFSAYMESHKGDLAGFARQEGLASVHPAMADGRPVLTASKSAPQRAYVSVERGGSSGHQGTARPPSSAARGRGKSSKRR